MLITDAYWVVSSHVGVAVPAVKARCTVCLGCWQPTVTGVSSCWFTVCASRPLGLSCFAKVLMKTKDHAHAALLLATNLSATGCLCPMHVCAGMVLCRIWAVSPTCATPRAHVHPPRPTGHAPLIKQTTAEQIQDRIHGHTIANGNGTQSLHRPCDTCCSRFSHSSDTQHSTARHSAAQHITTGSHHTQPTGTTLCQLLA
jgi:hypothetical protein